MSPPVSPPKPAYRGAERRRHRRGVISKLLTAPIPMGGIESRLGSALATLWRRGWPFLAAAALIAALAVPARRLMDGMAPTITARDRAEALCYSLATTDPRTGTRFLPPMRIEPSAALVRGRFTTNTPAALALRDVMHLTDAMVIREWRQTVGDYEVTLMWLRLPPEGGARHWLVVGWMEGTDLAVCNFRFAGEDGDLSGDEETWGRRLLARILRPANFRAGDLPVVRLRAARGAGMPSLGPATGG